jgi:hypothetical protein
VRTSAFVVSSCFLALTTSTLAAQEAATRAPRLQAGSEVRYQQGTDTVWTSGRVVLVGNCLGVAPSLPPNAPASDAGFMVVMLSAVGKVELRVGTGSAAAWRAVPDAELTALRSCTIESR